MCTHVIDNGYTSHTFKAQRFRSEGLESQINALSHLQIEIGISENGCMLNIYFCIYVNVYIYV